MVLLTLYMRPIYLGCRFKGNNINNYLTGAFISFEWLFLTEAPFRRKARFLQFTTLHVRKLFRINAIMRNIKYSQLNIIMISIYYH